MWNNVRCSQGGGGFFALTEKGKEIMSEKELSEKLIALSDTIREINETVEFLKHQVEKLVRLHSMPAGECVPQNERTMNEENKHGHAEITLVSNADGTVTRKKKTMTQHFIPADEDSEIIHEILELLDQKNLTVHRTRIILEKAQHAAQLVPFEWDKDTHIPFTY